MTTGFSGTTYTGGNQPTPVERAYVDGYKAGRIAALRECSNECRDQSCSVHGDGREPCAAYRLLADAESGEQVEG